MQKDAPRDETCAAWEIFAKHTENTAENFKYTGTAVQDASPLN